MATREGGYIVLQRSFWTSPDIVQLRADQRFVAATMVMLANWKAGHFVAPGGLIRVDRGQLAHTMEHIAEAANCKVATVRSTINRLSNSGFLTLQIHPGVGHGVRVITVKNYDKYQRVDSEEEESEIELPRRQVADASQTPLRQVALI